MRDRNYAISALATETRSKNIIGLNNNDYHHGRNITDALARKTNENNLKNNKALIDRVMPHQDSCIITDKLSEEEEEEEEDIAEFHGDGSLLTATIKSPMSDTVVTVNGRPVTLGSSVKNTSAKNLNANDRKFVSKTCIVDEDDSTPVVGDTLSVSSKDDSGDSGYGAKDAELEIGNVSSTHTECANEPIVLNEKVAEVAVATGTTGTSVKLSVGSEIHTVEVPSKSSSHLHLAGSNGTTVEVPVEPRTTLTLPVRGKNKLESKKLDKEARLSASDVQMTINGEVVSSVDSARQISKDKLTSRLSASKEKLFHSKEKIAGSREKLFSSKEKLFSGSRDSLFLSKEKIFGGSKEKFSFANGKSSTLKSKPSSTDGSCHQTLKVQYSDVVGVANKLSKIFCRSRSQTYNLRRKEKGMSLPASFSQTTGNWVTIANLRQLDGGILDLDDRLRDVVDDRDQIIAVYTEHCPRKGEGPPGVTRPPRSDGVQSTAHSRSHTPDIFQVGECDYGTGLNTTDIEVTGEELNNTPPPLHVRRGSEPTLNRLSPIPLDLAGGGAPSPPAASHTVVGGAKKGVHNKRWSAAPVIDNDTVTPPSSTPVKIHDPRERVFVYPGEERGEGSGEEKNPSSSASSSASSHHSATGTAFARFARDANRCSVQVLSDNPTMTRWADAAERVGGSGMSYNEMRRRDPVGGASTSPHHSRQASLDIRHTEDCPVSPIYKSNYDSKNNNAFPHHDANGLGPAGGNNTGFAFNSRNSCGRLYDEAKSGRENLYGESRPYSRHDRSHSHDAADVRYYSKQGQGSYSEAEASYGRDREAPQMFSASQDEYGSRGDPSSLPHTATVNNTDHTGNEERVLVVLNNGCGPLGIHVVPSPAMGRGDQQGSGGLLVEGVEEGGRVAQDGRIEVHDRIVDINGHSLLNTTFHQAQEIFKNAMQSPALRLLVAKTRPRAPSAPATTPATSTTTTATAAKPTSLSARTQAAMLASASRRPGRLISLCLTKGPHGLGFSITTRDNPARGHAPIYIKSVLPKGAAIEEGTLRIGDKLVSVNGKEVTGLSQTEVANMLRRIPVGGRAVLEVSRQERGVETNAGVAAGGAVAHGAASGTDGALPGDVKDRLKDDHPPSPQLPRPIGIEKSWEDSLMFPWKQRELITLNIPVHDSERAGLGVSVKGKTSSGSHGSNGPVDLGIFVKNVICGGAASRDGRLRENDQLININGLSLLGKPNSEAMTTLRIAMHQEGPTPGMITLTIARRMAGAQAHSQEAEEHYSNSLPRSGRDSSNSGSTGNETVAYLGGARTAPTTPTPYEGLSTDYTAGRFPPNNSTPCGDPLSSVLHNPVLHRLTGNTAALRNDSYYQATHDTWNNSELAAALPHTTPSKGPREACVGGEEGTGGSSPLGSPTVNLPQRDTLLIQEEYSPGAAAGSGEPLNPSSCLDDTYNSQTSLEGSGVGGGFSRDQFGRQSMSEKRHATLDAKNTDTYQRNKKVREERERQKQQQQAGEKSSGKERPSHPDIGPGLGMKKSSSLESLQTMVQEVTLAEEEACEGAGGRKGGSGRVPRGRGCNESFRAAVDRSYDAPLVGDDASPVMDTLAEEEADGLALQATDLSKAPKLGAASKKNKGLLKGLGSMFRFGKHRKTLDSNVMAGPDSAPGQSDHPPPPPPREGSSVPDEGQDPGEPPSGGASCSRAERMHQLRAEHQLRHLQRNGTYPTDKDEDTLAGQAEKRLTPVPAPPAEARPNKPEQFGLPAHRPGSRGTRGALQSPAATNSLQFAHYANYQQIQQHLRNEEQERLKQLASQQYRDFREKHYSRDNREYQSQRGPRDGHGSISRPVSNYYEYESVQAMMSHAASPSRQPHPPRAAHHREDLPQPPPVQFSNSPVFATQHQGKKINHANTANISIGSSNSSNASSSGAFPPHHHHHHQQSNNNRVPMGPQYNNSGINNNSSGSNPNYSLQSHRNQGPGYGANAQYAGSNSSGTSSSNNNNSSNVIAIGSMHSNNTSYSSYDSNAVATQSKGGQNSLSRRSHGQQYHSSENSHMSSNEDSLQYPANNTKHSLKQHQPPRRHKQAPPPPPPASSIQHHPHHHQVHHLHQHHHHQPHHQPQQYQSGTTYNVNNNSSKSSGQMYPPTHRNRQPPPPPPPAATLAPTHHRHPLHGPSRGANPPPQVPGSKV